MKSKHRLGKGPGICCATPASKHPGVPGECWDPSDNTELHSYYQLNVIAFPAFLSCNICITGSISLFSDVNILYILNLHEAVPGILNFVETVFITNVNAPPLTLNLFVFTETPSSFSPLPSQGYKLQPNFQPTTALTKRPQTCPP